MDTASEKSNCPSLEPVPQKATPQVSTPLDVMAFSLSLRKCFSIRMGNQSVNYSSLQVTLFALIVEILLWCLTIKSLEISEVENTGSVYFGIPKRNGKV